MEANPYEPPKRIIYLWRTLIFITVLVFLGVIACAVYAAMWPAQNSLVGSTERAIRRRYGQPSAEFAGHYGLPPLRWSRQFRGEVKSAVFRRLGGKLYVTFEKRDDEWVVISNSYLHHGSAF